MTADAPRVDAASAPVVPAVGRRIALSTMVALLAAAVTWQTARTTGQLGVGGSDFDQLWVGARGVLQGRDPYSLIGPGREFEWQWPLLYPMPALIAAVPFALLPVLVARVLFASFSAGVLTFAITRRGYHLLPILASAAMLDATRAGQLAPLLAASLLLPRMFWIAVLKPNVGVALATATESRDALYVGTAGGVLLLALSFSVQSDWVQAWLRAVRAVPNFRIPAAAFGGPFLLALLFRWRRLDARILLAYACVPHTPVVYDLVPLGLVAKTRMESLAFALLTYAALFAQQRFLPPGQPNGGASTAAAILNLTVYLPLLALIFIRSNDETTPAWLMLIKELRARRG